MIVILVLILTGFNPLPAIRPGDTSAACHPPCRRECFNPLPAIRPGDTPVSAAMVAVVAVFQSTPGD